MLDIRISDNSPFAELADRVLKTDIERLKECYQGFSYILEIKDTVSLYPENKKQQAFTIDILNEKLLWRLNHSGKKSEAVSRAVLSKLESPNVFDATAGLGRESMILQNSSCNVTMFERNPVVYLMLYASLENAKKSPLVSLLKNGLPVLAPFGTIKENLVSGSVTSLPDVIYYDPMFPSRSKTALVKKEMQVFHEIVGADLDTNDYAAFLCSIAKHHVVIKRPSNEEPLDFGVRRSSFVDGKACRFDCYFTGPDNK
ncbi:MAG: class I SAM-dependent methyltransferase [Succinivibrio sp.]